MFLTEAAGMGIIVFTVGCFLSVPRLAPFVPWLVGILVGLGIAMLGTNRRQPKSRTSVRAALVSGHTDNFGCSYWLRWWEPK